MQNFFFLLAFFLFHTYRGGTDGGGLLPDWVRQSIDCEGRDTWHSERGREAQNSALLRMAWHGVEGEEGL